jgi:hypothetical protein
MVNCLIEYGADVHTLLGQFLSFGTPMDCLTSCLDVVEWRLLNISAEYGHVNMVKRPIDHAPDLSMLHAFVVSTH